MKYTGLAIDNIKVTEDAEYKIVLLKMNDKINKKVSLVDDDGNRFRHAQQKIRRRRVERKVFAKL